MTREEATKWLKTFKGRTGMAELSQAFDVAIKALEQEPQTDEIILSKKEYRELLSNEFEHGYDKGLSDAIKSLEQESMLDKIRAEIDSYCSDNRDRNDGLYIAMRIIDKYRESEVKNEDSN